MNSFGRLFQIRLFGGSHDSETGVIITGCPAGIVLKPDDFRKALTRRKPGAVGTTARLEDDIPLIKSGIENSLTTGESIVIAFENKNVRSSDYDFGGFFRPGHADFVAFKKYGNSHPMQGGGMFSGRTTIGLVAAGVVASKIISEIEISAQLSHVGGSNNIEAMLKAAIEEADSLGGVIECTVQGIAAGLGEPYFDSIESIISHAMFSIPGIKAISFGKGIEAASMKGSEYNDCFIDANGNTATNNAGGINGGISNGNNVVFTVFVRPPASIPKEQYTYNFETGTMGCLQISGRHDVCFALRLPIVVEMMTAVVLADFVLLSNTIQK